MTFESHQYPRLFCSLSYNLCLRQCDICPAMFRLPTESYHMSSSPDCTHAGVFTLRFVYCDSSPFIYTRLLARPRLQPPLPLAIEAREQDFSQPANVTSQNWIFLPIQTCRAVSHLDWANIVHSASEVAVVSIIFPTGILATHLQSSPSVTNTSNVFFSGYERQVVTVCDVNHVILYAFAYSFIKAGVIVTIQVNYLHPTRLASHNPHTLLSFGVVLNCLASSSPGSIDTSPPRVRSTNRADPDRKVGRDLKKRN